jgi:hypothetical protein
LSSRTFWFGGGRRRLRGKLVSRSVLEGGQLGPQGLHFSVERFDFGSQFLLLLMKSERHNIELLRMGTRIQGTHSMKRSSFSSISCVLERINSSIWLILSSSS